MFQQYLLQGEIPKRRGQQCRLISKAGVWDPDTSEIGVYDLFLYRQLISQSFGPRQTDLRLWSAPVCLKIGQKVRSSSHRGVPGWTFHSILLVPRGFLFYRLGTSAALTPVLQGSASSEVFLGPFVGPYSWLIVEMSMRLSLVAS